MFFSEHRLKIASLRIGKHRIVKKSEHRPPLAEPEVGIKKGSESGLASKAKAGLEYVDCW